MADTDRAIGTPGGFERERAAGRIVSGPLDAEPVGEIDQGSVTRVADAVASVIGSHHAHAGLVIVPQRFCSSVAPGLVAKTHAFADCPGGAGDGKAGGAARVAPVAGPISGQRETRDGPIWARRGTQIAPLSGADVAHQEIVQPDIAVSVRRIGE